MTTRSKTASGSSSLIRLYRHRRSTPDVKLNSSNSTPSHRKLVVAPPINKASTTPHRTSPASPPKRKSQGTSGGRICPVLSSSSLCWANCIRAVFIARPTFLLIVLSLLDLFRAFLHVSDHCPSFLVQAEKPP